MAGSTHTFTKTYTSSVSQADAQAQADADATFAAEGQAYANSIGTCSGDPTIISPSLSCRTTGSCNDNASCGVRYTLNFVYLDAAKVYTASIEALGGIGPASASLTDFVQSGAIASANLNYLESNGSQSVDFDIVLYQDGAEVDRLNQSISHNSAFAFIDTCAV